MIKIVALKPDHFDSLDIQPEQRHILPYINKEYVDYLTNSDSFSCFYNGEIIGCGGMIEVYQDRAILWSLVGANAGKAFVAAHRAVERFLSLYNYRRVETIVLTSHYAAHRWIRMLGFVREGTMTNYFNGTDFDLYARCL